ncbi:hypothetical protein BJ138DRAFT_1198728 [Hygrophoropsis aurantiaca]|uniref:Uncharacterized protein n=1 Tax=Hygrophoropsis aurantiaca TaxID=72124 RepID=A0ACB7ZPC1_9AGAM|nr:hypothetical protein BJ138DRAFT_1198728 [Hygrophoropsis aurantiaca]
MTDTEWGGVVCCQRKQKREVSSAEGRAKVLTAGGLNIGIRRRGKGRFEEGILVAKGSVWPASELFGADELEVTGTGAGTGSGISGGAGVGVSQDILMLLLLRVLMLVREVVVAILSTDEQSEMDVNVDVSEARDAWSTRAVGAAGVCGGAGRGGGCRGGAGGAGTLQELWRLALGDGEGEGEGEVPVKCKRRRWCGGGTDGGCDQYVKDSARLAVNTLRLQKVLEQSENRAQ